MTIGKVRLATQTLLRILTHNLLTINYSNILFIKVNDNRLFIFNFFVNSLF